MARKRNKLNNIDYQTAEYWNRLLAAEGLAMDKGRDPRLVYSEDLGVIEAAQRRREDGRARPEGHGPDRDTNGDSH